MDQVQSPIPPVRYPLEPLVTRWTRVMDQAERTRHEEFGKWAEEAMGFFDGPCNFMWDNINNLRKKESDGNHGGFLASDAHIPQFQMSVNRLFEAVSLFGPALYYQDPDISVVPRLLPEVTIDAYFANNPQASQLLGMTQQYQMGMLPPEMAMMFEQMQQEYAMVQSQMERSQDVSDNHAAIIEALANYMQQSGDKQTEGRLAITEAIITGLGLLETRMEVSPTSGTKIPRSRYLSYKDLLVDPDAVYWRDVKWIGIRSVSPVNEVEKEFGLRPGSIKGQFAKGANLHSATSLKKPRNGDGSFSGTHELVEYWTIYSKNGAGQHIKMAQQEREITGLEQLGDFVKLVICKGVKYPLNLGPDVLMSGDPQFIMQQAQWEVPYWDDYAQDGGWPISRLCFYDKPGQVWPISMVKPCLGEMRFINWCMSFIADKVSAGSRIYVGVLKSAGEQIRSQLTSGQGPYSILELEKIVGNRVEDAVSFLKSPDFSIDIWKMVAEVNHSIDKRLGLTELIYGLSGRQMRSATEANVRQENVSIRPDDMASRVESWLATSATREIQAVRFLCEYNDVLPIIGPIAAQVFAEQILTDEVSRITRDYTYRVVGGSARKPNKVTQIEDMTTFGQYFLPVAQQAMMMGFTKPYNAYLKKMGDAMDMDVSDFIFSPEDEMMMQQMMAQSQMDAQADREMKASGDERDRQTEIEKELIKSETAKETARSRGNSNG